MNFTQDVLRKIISSEVIDNDQYNDLKGILIDWLQNTDEDLNVFLDSFLFPCIEIYAKEDRMKKYIEKYPAQSISKYFYQHFILYLAANYPRNDKFKMLFECILVDKKAPHGTMGNISRPPSLHQFRPDFIHLGDICIFRSI